MAVASTSSTSATLWHQFAAPLRSFVMKRAPREVEAEDVLQDVFVRIQEQLPNLRDADRIDAWIFQIARNVVADAFRRRARNGVLADRTADELATPANDDDRAAEASLATCLASMIAQLPEPYREAILLTELCGMTQADAATRVGISVSGMKSRVQRGREHLKRIIGGSCRVEIDARGGVTECDPRGSGGCGDSMRPSPCSNDSTGMSNTNEAKNTETNTTTPATSGCCGGPAPKESSACCALDAEVKATGGAGCGCGAKTAAATTTKKGCC
jgi:RNA polymerase sigma-70 factor (ECF subfamily)